MPKATQEYIPKKGKCTEVHLNLAHLQHDSLPSLNGLSDTAVWKSESLGWICLQ